MNEKYDDNDDDINIINTNTKKNIDINKNKIINSNINTYISTINEKSTIFDDNLLLNSEIPFPNSNSTNYIQSSIPNNIASPINNKLETEKTINKLNEMPTIQEPFNSIIDKLNDKFDSNLNLNIQNTSIIPLNTIKDSTISPDCNLGLSIVSSKLLSSFMSIDPNYILSPLLNIRKRCFTKLTVEDIMKWQKSELKEPLLKMEDEFDIDTFRKMQEIEKRGGDPVEDYAKYDKIFRREEHEKQLESQRKEIEMQERIENDKKTFKERYPDVDMQELLNDKQFKAFGKRAIDHGDSICDVYADYLEFNSGIQQNVHKEAERKVARQIASPGSLGNNGENKQKSVLDMTDEEFRKYRRDSLGLD